MTPERWREVERLLELTLSLGPEPRARLLDSECASDPELRAEVEALLAAAAETDGFLDPVVQWRPPEGATGTAPPDRSGNRLGPYLLERLLGRGGMGEVYLARDERLERAVAIKIPDPVLAAEESWRRRFLREAQLASTLDHPGICTVHDFGEAGGTPYLVLRYVEGRSLADELRAAPMPRGRALRLAVEVADAIATAHDRGILHRDIKSSNILIGPDDRPVVLDFGLAKRMEELVPGDADPRLTATGAVLGTPTAMSPEQAAGEPTDERSDLFSFGVVLYEMLTGELPFRGSSRVEILSALLSRPHRPPVDLDPSLPAELSSLVDRLLAKRPEDRPASMREVATELREIAASAEPGHRQRPPGRALRAWWAGWWRQPAWRAVGIVAAVVALTAAVLALRAAGPKPAPSIQSIAVLPFLPLVAQIRDESLELGITEALIHQLSSVEGLRVRPLSAVRRYGDPDTDPLAAGREQRVDAVLHGRIQHAGGLVRITAQMQRVREGALLWSDQQVAAATEIFALQDALARKAASALAGRLTGEDLARLVSRPPTSDADAYRHYLLARFHAAKRTREGLERSIELYRLALARDPGFAQAWAGLAASWSIGGGRDALPREIALAEARTAAERALDLDPSVAEAHGVIGSLQRAAWDWAGAERAYRRALELEPNHAGVTHWYGSLLSALGRGDEAVAVLQRAREIDPMSAVVNLSLGMSLLGSGRLEEAEAQFRLVLELDAAFPSAHFGLGNACFAQGREAEAVAEWLVGERLTGLPAAEVEELQLAFEQRGLRGFFERSLELAARPAHAERYSPLVLAFFHLRVDDLDGAFARLESAVSAGMPEVEGLRSAFGLEALRTDPRFADLLRRVGLAA